ncbi:hypothetical protein PPERSA_02661 [Pseudocohnilembus persalinus]|uniref:Uncharacterized protein n=1 Tax=Pseudocohnilembus persalinus TaxID=266149 RepID=A0A0V0R5L1_PSEPJ|nr:hypothetical protein PPERSA_02661 [Pseudocohnilembus persalinus]|eukprot:KRX09789.1 hypothetical protein PPERSA_02661 [Pseudocohnilembus persalinus]
MIKKIFQTSVRLKQKPQSKFTYKFSSEENQQKSQQQQQQSGKQRYHNKKQGPSNTAPSAKISIDKALETMENKFNIKLQNQTQTFQKILPEKSIIEKLSQKNDQQQQSQEQKFQSKISESAAEKLKARKQNLLKNLQKKESEKQTFNQIFKSNEMKYVENIMKKEKEAIKLAEYQLNQVEKQENAVDHYETDNIAKQEIANHIYYQDKLQEQQIMAYLGFSEMPNKKEQLKEWRDNQIVENIDFTPDTMGVKEIFYPGSKKGRAPADDMETFGEWYKQNMPKPYQLILNNLQELNETKIRNENAPSFLKAFVTNKAEGEMLRLVEGDTGHPNQYFVQKQPQNTVHVSELNALSAPLIEDIPDNDPYDAIEKVVFEDNNGLTFGKQLGEDEIPIFPEFLKSDHHYSVDLIDKWSIFRLHPIFQKGLRILKQMTQNYANGNFEDKKIVLPTLYAYYYTLPKQLQENVIVKTTVRNLERAKHDMSLQDKHIALNFACKMTMPIHPLVEETLDDILSTEKYWVSAAEEDILLNRETPLEQQGEEEIKLVQEGDTSMQIQQDWNRPPRIDPNGQDEKIPDLPLQYYDNNDGFWDWHINKQQDMYSQVELPTFRPFFKH